MSIENIKADNPIIYLKSLNQVPRFLNVEPNGNYEDPEIIGNFLEEHIMLPESIGYLNSGNVYAVISNSEEDKLRKSLEESESVKNVNVSEFRTYDTWF